MTRAIYLLLLVLVAHSPLGQKTEPFNKLIANFLPYNKGSHLSIQSLFSFAPDS